jgi:hypothetical protein
MSDVLSRVENLEGKGIQELSLCKETTNWFELPACFRFKKITNSLQLWNCSITESINILLHFYDGLICLFACISYQ